MAFSPLDGPSKQYSLSVTTGAVVEVINTSSLDERKVVTIQPLTSDIWVYFWDGTNTPSLATVQNDGFRQFKKAMNTYEASTQQKIYIVAITATTSVRIVERA